MNGRLFVAAIAVAASASAWPVGTAAPQVSVARVGGATSCLKVPAPLVTILRASLSFSAGGRLFYARAVKSTTMANVYFVSAQIRSAQLGQKRPLGTWVLDKLQATASASPLNAAARAYSDLAAPDPGTVRITMATPGARASQRCVTKLI